MSRTPILKPGDEVQTPNGPGIVFEINEDSKEVVVEHDWSYLCHYPQSLVHPLPPRKQ